MDHTDLDLKFTWTDMSHIWPGIESMYKNITFKTSFTFCVFWVTSGKVIKFQAKRLKFGVFLLPANVNIYPVCSTSMQGLIKGISLSCHLYGNVRTHEQSFMKHKHMRYDSKYMGHNAHVWGSNLNAGKLESGSTWKTTNREAEIIHSRRRRGWIMFHVNYFQVCLESSRSIYTQWSLVVEGFMDKLM